MQSPSRRLKPWPLVLAIAIGAAAASAQTTPGTAYSYDNNGNLHTVAPTCKAGALLCSNACVLSDPTNCGACGRACPGLLNGYPTCSATAQCGLACNTGYQMSGGACQMTASDSTTDLTQFPATYSATIRWTTSAPATTRVKYRAVSMDGSTADAWTDLTTSASMTTAHAAIVTNLFPVAKYQVQAMGNDAAGVTFSFFTATLETPRGQYDVGVISYRDAPGWATTCPAQKNVVRIYLDNEDSSNANARSGWIGGIVSNSQGTLLPFCRIDGRRFRPLVSTLNTAYEYAVLALSDTCPAGSVPFWRHIDAEDDNEASRAWADRSTLYTAQEDALRLSPNYVDGWGNARLNFCMYRSSATPMGGFPDLSQPYGVFAPTNFAGAAERGWVFSDDENGKNGNAYSSPFPAESQRIVSSGVDTTFNLARVAIQPSCASGLAPCAGSCVALATSTASCGACGTACSNNHVAAACAAASCNAGVCAVGWADCNGNKQTDGCETSLLTDPANCGACGMTCDATMVCVAGRCEPPIEPPECTGAGCP